MLTTRRALLGGGVIALPIVAARPASHKNCPTDFTRIEGGKFFIGGTRVALKGVNYSGSWRQPGLLTSGRNVEQYSVWAFYHDWDIGRIEADFQFLRTQLNATCVRIGTPSVSDFARLVTRHGYLPWYTENGEIAEPYRSRLIDVADAAVRNGLRVQLCLLWNIANEMLSDGENFKPGAPRDVFYARQVQSVASALRNHRGVVAFLVGNEVLVRWKINTEHPTGYEPRAAGFMLRRFADLRAAAPHQLIALDEIAAVHKEFWFAPGMHFMPMADVDYSNHGRILASIYLLDPRKTMA